MNSSKILLLEEESVIASHLKKMLEADGFRVLPSSDAATALSLCSRHLPDFAILNFH